MTLNVLSSGLADGFGLGGVPTADRPLKRQPVRDTPPGDRQERCRVQQEIRDKRRRQALSKQGREKRIKAKGDLPENVAARDRDIMTAYPVLGFSDKMELGRALKFARASQQGG